MDRTTKHLTKRVSELEKMVHGLAGAPSKNYQHSVAERNDTDEEDEASVLLHSSAVSGPKYTKYTQQRGGSTIPRWKLALSSVRSKITLRNAGIVAGIVYALVTYLQWKDLRRNFETDERGWVRLSFAWPMPSTQSNHMEIGLQNVGKSPVTSYGGRHLRGCG